MQASPDPLPPYASTLRIHLITQVGDTRFSVLTPSVIRMEHHAGCTTGGTTGGGGCFDDEVCVCSPDRWRSVAEHTMRYTRDTIGPLSC